MISNLLAPDFGTPSQDGSFKHHAARDVGAFLLLRGAAAQPRVWQKASGGAGL
jgi:hypothetical protein